MKYRGLLALLLTTLGMWLSTSAAFAQTLSGAALVSALRKGGYVIVMRHASSPRETPNPNADNVNKERQLDAEGRASAAAMGKALRDLMIPVGEVLTSPTYRALETVRFAQWTNAKSAAELGDNGQGMQQVVPEAQAVWLQKRVTQAPKNTNAILVTHFPNINRAFPQSSDGLADGEALIFAPDGKGGAAVVARIKIEEWSRLGA
jgi:phosphohistidine phosphatase SixA